MLLQPNNPNLEDVSERLGQTQAHVAPRPQESGVSHTLSPIRGGGIL
jgi:hypothetical protein